MADGLVTFLREAVPNEISSILSSHLDALEKGDYKKILHEPLAKELFNVEISENGPDQGSLWCDSVFDKLGKSLSNRDSDDKLKADSEDSPLFRQHFFLVVAIAAIQSYVQSNVTGPVLPFSSAGLLFSEAIASSTSKLSSLRRSLAHSLSSDGVAAYSLATNLELLCLADTIITSPPIQKHATAFHWVKLRVDFLHQKLLSEISSTLQNQIYESIRLFNEILAQSQGLQEYRSISSSFRLEKAAVDIQHGLDKNARQELDQISASRKFEFAITGLLGKRTKYQQRDISQLVVLARSNDAASAQSSHSKSIQESHDAKEVQPANLDLNDDTLLENISFSEKPVSLSTTITDQQALPPALSTLDPSKQPLLHPLDSIVLLSMASAITNTSPADGLTREEALPYAVRVLNGGSSNWQVYTQALLIRSRIEGYRSRTSERGLLQLQALVDQIIADTMGLDTKSSGDATSFLPRATGKESAPASERLKFVYALNSPNRWDVEAELASRWVSVGGLRSALEIYERLEMWPEAALCWAAADREDKGRNIVRRRLFHATNGSDGDVNVDDEKWEGPARDPPPDDAPRLYCILGDFDKDVSMYEKAWEVSNSRYARAQRSLGRHYFAVKDYEKSAEAYGTALKVNRLHQNSWFAYGCSLLELSRFVEAAEAFSRVVQLDDSDAEAWSNLAASLLRIKQPLATASEKPTISAANDLEDEDGPTKEAVDPQKNKRDALKALTRAATLKHDSYRIWDNILTVSASLAPPAFADLLVAQKRIIELRGQTDGEKCIDINILEALVRYITTVPSDADPSATAFDPSKPGLARLVVELVEKDITPLITGSSRLWRVVASLALWRKKPSSALEAQEKAWRAATTHSPGWESGTEKQWNDVVDATIDLADAYESLGQMEKTEGLAAGSGELVAKDWKFKARSAVRGIMSKGKSAWEDSDGWNRLNECLEGIKTAG